MKELNLKSLKDLRKMKSEDLVKELKEAQKSLFSYEMKLSLNELKQTHLVKAIRKYIARVKTVSNSSN